MSNEKKVEVVKTPITITNKNVLALVDPSEIGTTMSEAIKSELACVLPQLDALETLAMKIVVKDELDLPTMAKAKEYRTNVKKIRTLTEDNRKRLKAHSLATGKAIDGVAGIINAICKSLEAHLEAQEKFAENKAAERLKIETERRCSVLTELYSDSGKANEIMITHSIAKMTTEVWDKCFEELRKLEEERVFNLLFADEPIVVDVSSPIESTQDEPSLDEIFSLSTEKTIERIVDNIPPEFSEALKGNRPVSDSRTILTDIINHLSSTVTLFEDIVKDAPEEMQTYVKDLIVKDIRNTIFGVKYKLSTLN